MLVRNVLEGMESQNDFQRVVEHWVKMYCPPPMSPLAFWWGAVEHRGSPLDPHLPVSPLPHLRSSHRHLSSQSTGPIDWTNGKW